MKTFRFRFYLGKKTWERTYKSLTITAAWKMSHAEAADYPSSQFIEIANLD